jgi:DNA-binding NtrC family response regulator
LALVVDDVEREAGPPRRLSAAFLGTREGVIAGSALAAVWEQATRVAKMTQPALLLGESGVGKEAVARLLHAASGREGRFVAINAAAVPSELFESELFGHERGSFSGAERARLGAFREADGGVLFLDEVADLRPEHQTKLLRALDQLRVRPVGSEREVAVDVRVVAATSRDIQSQCAGGVFRQDLYYRLAGIVIRVPPLRERREDVAWLTRLHLSRHAPNLSLSVPALERLMLAPWPGNVRELQHALTQAELAAVQAGASVIGVEHLPALNAPSVPAPGPLNVEALRAALARCGGSAKKAAQDLGVSRATFYNLCRRLGTDPSALRLPVTASGGDDVGSERGE